jgi:regulator of replication initiation timing
MTQKNRELDLIKKENERISNEMDVQLKSANTQLATVKQFARKLRDEKTIVATENTKLQEQLKLVQDELTKLRDTATIATSTASASSPSPSVPSLTIPTSSPGGLMTPEMRRRLHDQVAILTKEKEVNEIKFKQTY